MMSIEPLRRQMVAQQIRTWDVVDEKILGLLGELSRDEFAPPAFANLAYADDEIPLGHGQVMLRPSIVGKILQALQIEAKEQVLEVGCGSGYMTACLAHLAAQVSSVDVFEAFVSMAAENLATAGIENAFIQHMDVMSELPDATFDVICITSSVPEIHPAYGELLNNGGRLFVFVGESPLCTGMLMTRVSDDEFEVEALFESDVPSLVNLDPGSEFLF